MQIRPTMYPCQPTSSWPVFSNCLGTQTQIYWHRSEFDLPHTDGILMSFPVVHGFLTLSGFTLTSCAASCPVLILISDTWGLTGGHPIKHRTIRSGFRYKFHYSTQEISPNMVKCLLFQAGILFCGLHLTQICFWQKALNIMKIIAHDPGQSTLSPGEQTDKLKILPSLVLRTWEVMIFGSFHNE